VNSNALAISFLEIWGSPTQKRDPGRGSKSHVFHNFVHGRLVVHFIDAVGIHAYVRRIEHAKKTSSGNSAVEIHTAAQIEAKGEVFMSCSAGPPTDDSKADI